jgi:hypothetical protein
MVKFCYIALCLLLCIQCREAAPDTAGEDSQELDLTQAELPTKDQPAPAVRELLSGWKEYQDLASSLDGIYRVGNREELRLLLEEILEKEKALGESEYPELFDRPQVFSRQKVFKTYLLKTKASIEYRTDPLPAARDMIAAFNALGRQFNVLVNSQLDTTLISDE